MSRRHKRPFGEAHVRLYRHELESPAWRTLSVDARALLIELRALFDPKRGDNRVFLGMRQAMERLGIGQRRVETARTELLERGWITVAERGSFTRKVRHATAYALENEPPSDAAGAVPSKMFMRWRPCVEGGHGSRDSYRDEANDSSPRYSPQLPTRKNTVAAMHTDGSRHSYRDPSELVKKCPDGSRHEYREGDFPSFTVAATATQILLPRGYGERNALLVTALARDIPLPIRTVLLMAWLASVQGLVNEEGDDERSDEFRRNSDETHRPRRTPDEIRRTPDAVAMADDGQDGAP